MSASPFQNSNKPSTEKSSTTLPHVKHVIAVSSGKGGVGKSTISVNLACALSLQGKRVGILDADVYGPNIPTMMGVVGAPKIENHPEKGEIFVPPTSHGVKVMSMGFLIEGDQPLAWRGPMLHNVIKQFCFQVNWGELDVLVIDMPPGTGDVQLSMSQLLTLRGAVVVTTPQEISMQDVRKAITMFDKVRIPMIGLVENMSYFEVPGSSERHYIFGKDGAALLAKKYRSTVLAQIPLVQAVREGGDEGVPIVVRDPNSSVAKALMTLASEVWTRAEKMAAETYQPSDIIQIGKFE